jgi:predicted methyltransferase
MIRNPLILAASTLASLLLFAACTHAPSAPTAPATSAAPSIPSYINAAIADPNRPDTDKQRDASRKPAQTLEFAGVHPGEQIGELVPGGGYFTRLFSKAVGPTGHVYAMVPPRPANPSANNPDRGAAVAALAADPNYPNISVVELTMGKVTAPVPLDLVFTGQNYHDLHNIPSLSVAAFNKSVFDSLKPGGLFVVLDHSAQAGSGAKDTNTLHRIDADTVKTEVTAAGFEFVASSDILANPADPRTANVFDPSIRGKTDQFILKFRKPKK